MTQDRMSSILNLLGPDETLPFADSMHSTNGAEALLPGVTGRAERHIAVRRVNNPTKTEVNWLMKDIVDGKSKISVKTKNLLGKSIIRSGPGTAAHTIGFQGGILT